jgi:porin
MIAAQRPAAGARLPGIGRPPRSWCGAGAGCRLAGPVLAATLSLVPPGALAQEHGAATLTGDWNGARTRLADAGVAFRGDYVSETFASVQGGLRRGNGYAQQLRLGVDVDLGRAAGWQGTILHFTVNDRRGKGVSSEFVGNRLPVQEVYGGLYTRLSEASVEQDLAQGAFNLRLGFFAMGNDLGGMALGCNFVNAAFCAHPLSLSGNSGWYNYPNARWGIAVRYRLGPAWWFRTGAYQVNPRLGDEENAFKPFAGGTTGTLLPLELEYAPATAPGSAALPGHYKAGVYHDSSRAARQGDSGTVGGRHGFYVLADQVVLRDGAGPRNLAVFGQFTASPRESAPITRWYAAGLVKTGTFPGRDGDTVGLGVVHAEVNPRLRRAHVSDAVPAGAYASLPAGETVIELSYGWQARRWLGLRADVQYIVDPGAFSYRVTRNALVLGGQVRITF